jgi:hypothetical protein
MKIRSLFALVGLAISFAVSVLAREQNTVDPEVRQQVEAELTFDDAFNNNDAAAIVSLFTPDAIEVWGWDNSLRAAFGRHAVERRYAPPEPIPDKFSNKLVQVYPIGDGICRPYDQGVTEALFAGYGLLGKPAPAYVALPALPVTRENLLDAWKNVYHTEAPASVRDRMK